MMERMKCLVALVGLWTASPVCRSFTPHNFQILTGHSLSTTHRHSNHRQKLVLWGAESSGDSGGEESSSNEKSKMTLEEKMKSWEASEEEIKAATLGGVVPKSISGDGRERTGAFDVGLYIAFPIMVITGLIFALFPFIMGSLDVDSVGPPPTM
jgi:hypothetical protein